MRTYSSAALLLIPLCLAVDLPALGQSADYRALVKLYSEQEAT